MAILKIARMGHPVLRRIAEPVEDPSAPEIQRLLADMADTLADAQGVGLAAPQVFVSRAVMMFFVPASRVEDGAGDDVPLTVLINPEIEPLDCDEVGGWEGCLSIPGLQGYVPRWARIRYRGLGASGQRIEREAGGFHARVVQHEYDHLQGILYPERMTDMTRLAFSEELQRHPPDDDTRA
ncbi:peptide deformylase [Salinisphaera sp. T31B1]|uniref:peptide deformylase n=1 Tax=Salinisphaera sp. T31B1 TaxID=727963 RepID=UPI00333F3BBD